MEYLIALAFVTVYVLTITHEYSQSFISLNIPNKLPEADGIDLIPGKGPF